jgi:hypothetical protein
VFYGADDRVYFSQVFIDDLDSLGRCYQRNDPTAEISNDILDTDGGEILLQECGSILAMCQFQLGILVFCSKGVWYISGGDGGFKATAYKVDKVSSDRIVGTRAYTPVGSDVMMAASDGLYVISSNEFGVPKIDSITDSTIKTYWQTFSQPELQLVYDEQGKRVYMLRCSCDEGSALLLDLQAGAFYPWQLKGSTVSVPMKYEGLAYSKKQQQVVFFARRTNDTSTLRFTVAKEQPSNLFLDLGVESYSSYIVTNPETLGNYTRKKGVPLIDVYMRKTETSITEFDGVQYVYDKPSGCSMSLIWEWGTQGNARRSSPSRSIYNPVPRWYAPEVIPTAFDTGDSIITYKDKIRGTGKAVQFRFESIGDKDMQILGFSVGFSAKGRM